MKRLFTFIIAGMVLISGITPALSSAETYGYGNGPADSSVRRPCTAIAADLSYGAQDRGTNTSVYNMQLVLNLYGYLGVQPTGYFGSLTRTAVKAFQKANGLPQTGYFGPLSRGVMKKLSCADDMPVPTPTPVPTSNVTVLSPNGGETYVMGSTQTLTWTSPNVTYIQAPRFTLSLVPQSPCELHPGQPCPMLLIKPYTIAQNVIGSAGTSTYSWNVGTINDQGRTLPEGKYRLQVCDAGGNNCDSSNAVFTIASTTNPTQPGSPAISISSMTPTSGASGTQVTITGYGFTAENNLIKFGDGYAGNVSSRLVLDEALSNGTTRSLRSITFTVPYFNIPECAYASVNRCVTTQGGPTLSAGNYTVIVSNTYGSSGPQTFTLTR